MPDHAQEATFGSKDDGSRDGGGGCHGHHWHGGLKPETIDQIDVTTYLHSDQAADGSFTEKLILQATAFEHDGATVDLSGFGSKYGMYFLIDATGQNVDGVTSFNTLNIALMVDRGNNDGALSSSEYGGVGFASGTHGDYALATGTLVSASIQVDPDGTRHPNLVEKITPTCAGEAVFGGTLNAGDLLREVLTTPSGPHTFPQSGGGLIQVIDGTGHGTAALTPQAPLTVLTGLLGNDFRPHFGDALAAIFH